MSIEITQDAISALFGGSLLLIITNILLAANIIIMSGNLGKLTAMVEEKRK